MCLRSLLHASGELLWVWPYFLLSANLSGGKSLERGFHMTLLRCEALGLVYLKDCIPCRVIKSVTVTGLTHT